MCTRRFETWSVSNRLLLNRGWKQTLDHIKKLQRARHHGRELVRAFYFYEEEKSCTEEVKPVCGCCAEKLCHVCILLDILLIFLLSQKHSAEFLLAVSQDNMFQQTFKCASRERERKECKAMITCESAGRFHHFLLNGMNHPCRCYSCVGGVHLCVCDILFILCVSVNEAVPHKVWIWWIPHIRLTHIIVSITETSKTPKTNLDTSKLGSYM